ncbi:MAG: hypothetical protein ACRC4T_08260 [Cetobacterium sp.]
MSEFKRVIQRTTNSERIESGVAQLEVNEFCIVEDGEEVIYKNKDGEYVSISKDKYTVGTIEELKSSNKYKIGDIVQILGLNKNDGQYHKRIISKTQNHDGIKLYNNLWANVYFNSFEDSRLTTKNKSIITSINELNSKAYFEENFHKFEVIKELDYIKNTYNISNYFPQSFLIDNEEIVVLVTKNDNTETDFIKLDLQGNFIKSIKLTGVTDFPQGVYKYDDYYYLKHKDANKVIKMSLDLIEIVEFSAQSYTSDLTGESNKLITSDWNNYYITNLDTGALEQTKPRKNYKTQEKVQGIFSKNLNIYSCGGMQGQDIRIEDVVLNKDDLQITLNLHSNNFEIEGSCIKDGELYILLFCENTFYIVKSSGEGKSISYRNTGTFLGDGSVVFGSQLKQDFEDFVFKNCARGETLKIYAESGLNLVFKGLKIQDYSVAEFSNINDYTYLMKYYAYNGCFSSIFSKPEQIIKFQNLEEFKIGGFWFLKNNQSGQIMFRYTGDAKAMLTSMPEGTLPQKFKNPMNLFFPVFYQNDLADVRWVGMQDGFFYNANSLPTGNVYVFGNYFNEYFTGYLTATKTTSIEELNTPYHVVKMQQEGVYDDFITYMDSKLESDRCVKNQNAEGLITLQILKVPIPSEKLLAFKIKYLGE